MYKNLIEIGQVVSEYGQPKVSNSLKSRRNNYKQCKRQQIAK